jgi:DNA-directed RNA polymerase subunit E'/Rpb7
MDESLFVRVLVKDKVKLQAKDLGGDYQDKITQRLLKKYESVCSHHGYIRRGSIQILKISLGRVEMVTLNGDVTFHVQYSADVCNPAIGNVVKAHIVNMNKFGVLAEAGVRHADGSYVPILNIIVAKQSVSHPSEVDLESLHTNDEIFIEVLGRKYELNDTRISVVGRVVADTRGAEDPGSHVEPEGTVMSADGSLLSEEDEAAADDVEDEEDDELFSFEGSDELNTHDKGPDEEESSQNGGFISDNDECFGELEEDMDADVDSEVDVSVAEEDS